MTIKNTHETYGVIAIALHWLVAVLVVGLFALGWWMTGLDYYSSWYQTAPFIHKSLGMVLVLLLVARLIWRFINIQPDDEPGIPRWQFILAHGIHHMLYLLLFVIVISGYLISTADGRGIEVFGWFSVPALVSNLPEQEDIAGVVHWYVALILMGLVLIHMLAALTHHFIDRDRTLKKILGLASKRSAN